MAPSPDRQPSCCASTALASLGARCRSTLAARVTRVRPGDYTPQPQAFDLIVLDGSVPAVLPAGSSVLLLHPPANNGFLGVGPEVNVSTPSAARQGDALLADVPLGSVHVSRSRKL